MTHHTDTEQRHVPLVFWQVAGGYRAQVVGDAAAAPPGYYMVWIVDNQGDVFQYVMNSQTYAFDNEQQQRVLNSFYRVNDPKDKKECLEKRPRRNIDPSDGTHCLTSKITNTPMQAAGR